MVDLEALKAELEAEGFKTTLNQFGDEDPWLECYAYESHGLERVSVDAIGNINTYAKPTNWPAIDIIRCHVAPPEPVTLTAEERESMSIALFDAYWSGSPRTRGFRWHQSDEPELWHGLRDKFLEHLTAHGFALVRTKAVSDGA